MAVKINGKTISVGNNIHSMVISRKGVFVNGKKVEEDNEDTLKGISVHVEVVGDVEKLEIMNESCSISGSEVQVNIKGNADTIENGVGDVNVEGDVAGDVRNNTGDVTVKGEVRGDARTNVGDIRAGTIKGSATTNVGDIRGA